MIGRIRWEAIHVKGDFRTGGEKLVDLADVTIQRIGVDRRQQIRLEVAASFQGEIGSRLAEFEEMVEKTLLKKGQEEDLNKIVQIMFHKTIALNEVFQLGEGGGEVDAGFGLFGSKSDETLFSWDWFTVTEPGRATKLQESGEIRYQVVETDFGRVISHMLFDTDVSLRMSEFGAANPLDLSWRIGIEAGSELYWPFLTEDGSMVATGYLEEL